MRAMPQVTNLLAREHATTDVQVKGRGRDSKGVLEGSGDVLRSGYQQRSLIRRVGTLEQPWQMKCTTKSSHETVVAAHNGGAIRVRPGQ